MPGPAPAVVALCCPPSLGFSSMEELETGCGGKSGEALHLPYAMAAGPHQFSFLHQTSIMGRQQCICRTVPEAQQLQCQGVPLPRRKGGGRARRVSCQSCALALGTGSLSQQGLEAEGRRTRALLDDPVLWALCPQRHEPISFLRPWQLLLCRSCAAEGTHRRCSNLGNNTHTWECDSCAGVGTCKCQSSRVLLGWGQGPDKAWQWGPGLGLAEPVCSRRAGAPIWPTLPQAWETSP